MPRWFTGLELPLQVRESLARLRQPLPGARWIEPRDLHLTLRFFGDIDTLTARELESFLEQIEADVAAGTPTNADGTINLVTYAAWLSGIRGMSRGD